MTELVFKGMEFVWNSHLAVRHRPMVVQPEKGVGDARLNGNLVVQGNNLHALKALLPMYAGNVDCIFIDPPYNPRNEGWASGTRKTQDRQFALLETSRGFE